MTTPLDTQEQTSSAETQDKNLFINKLKELHPTINAIIVVFGIIMVWRGVWALLDLHLFPNHPTFSALLSIVLGALVLHLDNFSLKDLKR
jgi:uncharacterized membrane protein